MLTDTWGGLTGNGGNGYLDLVIKLLPQSACMARGQWNYSNNNN